MCSVIDLTTEDIGSHFGSEIDMTEIIRRSIESGAQMSNYSLCFVIMIELFRELVGNILRNNWKI